MVGLDVVASRWRGSNRWTIFAVAGGLLALLSTLLRWSTITYGTVDEGTVSYGGLTVAGPFFLLLCLVVVAAGAVGRPPTKMLVVVGMAAVAALVSVVTRAPDPGNYLPKSVYDRGALTVDGAEHFTEGHDLGYGFLLALIGLVVVMYGIYVGVKAVR